MTEDVRHYDVAIAGGGPAGAAAAQVLARAGLRVLLADAGTTRAFKIGEGLPPSARILLRELGVLERVLSDGHRPSHGTVSAWGSSTMHAHDFIRELHGHGLQLDRTRFDALLRSAAHEAGATLLHEARLRLEGERGAAADPRRHCPWLRTPEGKHAVTCDWLIDAAGRPAVLARRLGAARSSSDALLAFHLRLGTRNTHDRHGSTLVEAVEDGWWYSVLLPSDERLVAFLGDRDLVDRRALLRRDGLWAKLQATEQLRALCERHGYAPLHEPHGADASSGRLDRCAGDRWLAVGDAALSFDPLASKGIANALYTGIRGAQALLSTLHGDATALPRYDAHLQQIFAVHREQLALHYAMETRWPHSAFWRRRTQPRATAAGI